MRGTLVVNFCRLEAPPALERTVDALLEELAEHCPNLVSCRVYVLREGETGPAGPVFRVRVEPGPRLCDRGPCDAPPPEKVDPDLGRALRRAFEAVKRITGTCAESEARGRAIRLPERGRSGQSRALLH